QSLENILIIQKCLKINDFEDEIEISNVYEKWLNINKKDDFYKNFSKTEYSINFFLLIINFLITRFGKDSENKIVLSNKKFGQKNELQNLLKNETFLTNSEIIEIENLRRKLKYIFLANFNKLNFSLFSPIDDVFEEFECAIFSKFSKFGSNLANGNFIENSSNNQNWTEKSKFLFEELEKSDKILNLKLVDSDENFRKFVQTVFDVSELVPDGIIVVVENFYRFCGLADLVKVVRNGEKVLFFETEDDLDFSVSLKMFARAVNIGRGSILFITDRRKLLQRVYLSNGYFLVKLTFKI
ncbi:hypothetical protein MHBO_003418, partial [Bonamia ostreae]